MPLAMSVVWDVVRFTKKNPKLAELLKKFDSVLGLKIDEQDSTFSDIPSEILELVEKRKIARENKNWAESDKIRDEIQSKGYVIKDLPSGEVSIFK